MNTHCQLLLGASGKSFKSPRFSPFIRVVFLFCIAVLSIGLPTCAKPDAKSKPLKVITRRDLDHGRRQLERMLRDRPLMRKFTTGHDALSDWVIRQFAGEGTGARIYWNNQQPAPPVDGDHVRADGSTRGSIRVRQFELNSKHKPIDGEHLWDTAIFELFNIRNDRAFNRIDDNAFDGRLTEKEYIRRSTELEYRASLATRNFYKSTWLPNTKNLGIPPNPACWPELDYPDTYEAWISQYTDRKSYPFDFYGVYYKKEILPYVREMRAWKTWNKQEQDKEKRWGQYAPYMRELESRIRSHWNPPHSQHLARVVVSFEIARNGTISNIAIAKSSGVAELDESMTEAVRAISPFEAIPAFTDPLIDSLPIEFTFDYDTASIKPSRSKTSAKHGI